MMQGTKIQERAAKRTQELPGAELSHPFGVGWDVYKVRGRVFMLQTVVSDEPIVVLKAAPDDSRSLRETFTDITPGYHMNKKHWITLHPGGGVGVGAGLDAAHDAALVDDLVTDSYLLVVEKLPKKERPVDPLTFGQPPRP